MERLPLELVQAIDTYLAPGDRFQCLLVASSWRFLFYSLLYQDITLDGTQQHDQWVQRTAKQQQRQQQIHEIPTIRRLTLRNLLLPQSLALVHAPHCQLDTLAIVNSANTLLFPFDMEMVVVPTVVDPHPKYTIASALALHAASLSRLTLSYSTTLLGMNLPTLINALPPLLTDLAIHQITAPMEMTHLHLLYTTCPRLNTLSLRGHQLTLHSLPCPSLNTSIVSLRSLDLDFGFIDGLDVLFRYMARERHAKLTHLGLAIGLSTASGLEHCDFDPLYDDQRRPAYAVLAAACPLLSSLRMKNMLLTGLLATPLKWREIHIDMAFDMAPHILQRWITHAAPTIEAWTLLSSGGPQYDPAAFHPHLLLSKNMKSLDISLAYGLSTPYHAHPALADLPIQLNRPWLHLNTLNTTNSPDDNVVHDTLARTATNHITDRSYHPKKEPWTWMLDACTQLTSVTLRYSTSLLECRQLWLSTHLRHVTLYMVLLDRQWMTALGHLTHLRDIELLHCVCIHSAITLDLGKTHIHRINIRQLSLGRYTWYNPDADDALNSLRVHCHPQNTQNQSKKQHVSPPSPENHTPPRIFTLRSGPAPQKTMDIICHSLRTLVVDNKTWQL
ncbi:hypothetical protein BC940DRAFT_347961 [Gongronella butleri]|nr:hypothetical protein BC940DRAFT_347961 [Gongronella butleri]